ncbi:helix-turn-helix domain-containing protein [Microbacterium sp. cx-55]|uniref:helix-turn-helix domain-containing protein n=1 Tax=Microbacterium sp. cx-55 TaxID=2875948 RepID=UPI001CBB5A6F|nr:helix-turn-helix domain-containing protein [Microbacterium sp. cx-55]MBZ4486959.1 helix-turn-helix domain-containing protein [Microbacterium sp. cx-55]UGB35878.1 helix-turn-helix domain-containing protein [Microbacterium sp. cx-55]
MSHPFGELLRRRRQRADLTIEGLAEQSRVSVRTISDIERGMSAGPQRRTVIALADGLHLADQERTEFLSAARPGRRGAALDRPPVSVRPLRLPDFSGREAEMSVLASILSPQSTPPTPVVVTGTAGVGKTTVALEALHRAIPGGADILFVNLHTPDTLPLSSLQVLQALLRQIGVDDELDTIDDAVAAWRRSSANKSFAVLLDNVTNEAQVRPVLTASDAVRIVLTSQRSLTGLEGCQRVVLGSLARHESIDFLARTIPPSQQSSGELAELAELCADLPLALRIAGNRISSRPAWTVEDFARRLRVDATRLRQLVAGDLRVESTFTLSYEALTARSRQVFRSIPLITGASFRADMVASLHPFDDETTREVLDELTDLALLESLSGDRYRIHDLLRIFADRRLSAEQDSREIDAQRTRLRQWTLQMTREMALRTEETDAAAMPGEVTLASARAWLITEADTWLEALKVSAATPAESQVAVLDTARALTQFAERWLGYRHWRTVAQIGVSAAEHLGDQGALAYQLQMMAALELGLIDGDADVAEEIALRARSTAEAAGAGTVATWALISLAWSSARRGELDSALARARQALAEAREQRSPEAQVQTRYWIAIAMMPDDPEGALGEALEMRRVLDEHEADFSIREWYSSNSVTTAIAVKALLRLERYSDAKDVANRIMDDASFFPHEPDFLARAYRHRGFAHLGLQKHDEARSDLQRALELVQEHERPDWWAAEIQAAIDSLGPR